MTTKEELKGQEDEYVAGWGIDPTVQRNIPEDDEFAKAFHAEEVEGNEGDAPVKVVETKPDASAKVVEAPPPGGTAPAGEAPPPATHAGGD